MHVTWRGVFPAATTQFADDESLDIPATLDHLDRLIQSGVGGIIILGTVGENSSLEYSEKLDLVRAAAERVAGRVPLLAGVAESSTRLAARFAEDAARLGADGLMVLPAMIYKADPTETLTHFRTVISATDLPIMVYNNPVSYHIDIRPEMFGELAQLPSVVAIKESSEDVRRITDLINLYGDRFRIFCGVDDLVLESVLLGAVGWVSGLVNPFPEENQLLWELAEAGEWKAAVRFYRWYTPLLHLDTHVKLVQYIKLAMHERGFGSEMVRKPRCVLRGSEREHIVNLVKKAIATRPSVEQVQTWRGNAAVR